MNHFFFQEKKIHQLHIKGYFFAENSYFAEVNFKSNITLAWNNLNIATLDLT